MVYCTKCGAQNEESNNFCNGCGQPIGQGRTLDTAGLDSSDKTWIFLGNVCISPLLGVVLYFVWKDTKPEKSKDACTLTWWALGLWAALILIGVIAVAISEM
ncbi:MAG: zinc-ribbon domain-containing protein [bacterium]